MRWKYVTGDPDSITLDGDQDRIVIDELEGEDNPLGRIAEIARWYAEENVRAGYDLKLVGDCNKGPQGINWGPLEIVFEHEPNGTPHRLRTHLQALWGAEGVTHATHVGDDEMQGLIRWLG